MEFLWLSMYADDGPMNAESSESGVTLCKWLSTPW